MDNKWQITYCCQELFAALKERETLKIMNHFPFKPEVKLETPSVFILNDGGHGGFYRIDFCPFCGKKIKITNTEIPTFDE